MFTLLAWIIHLYLLSCIPSFLTKNDWLTSRGSIHSLIGSYFAMQMLCTLPVLFIINKLLDMLNTLTKPRFQTFVKIFQGPTDTPSPRSSSSELKKCIDCIWFHLLPIFCSSYCSPSNSCLNFTHISLNFVWFLAKNESEFSLILCILSLISIVGGLHII